MFWFLDRNKLLKVIISCYMLGISFEGCSLIQLDQSFYSFDNDE